MAGDKRTTPLFFLLFPEDFFCLLKVQTSEGKVTFDITFFGVVSLPWNDVRVMAKVVRVCHSKCE